MELDYKRIVVTFLMHLGDVVRHHRIERAHMGAVMCILLFPLHLRLHLNSR